MWVWHPEVHERFGEQLMYFLLAVKPFKRDEHDADVEKLMQKFGIPRYCSYQLFGSYDSLLRVWLPPSAASEFKREIGDLPGCRYVYDFRVVVKRLCWAQDIPKQKGANSATIKHKAKALVVEKVRAEQSGNLSDKDRNELEKNYLLLQRPSIDGNETIKAFIAFSPPEQNYTRQVQESVEQQIQEVLTESGTFQFKSVTLMFGQGFCWALAKVVASKYSDLGRCVREASRKLSLYGINTQTHLVVDFPPPREGDSVSGEALKMTLIGDPMVHGFLPELYEPPPTGVPELDVVERAVFEKFVKEMLGKNQPASETGRTLIDDFETIKQFLRAAITNDRDAAFIALFPALKNAERRLREPVGRSAAKIYPGGVAALLDYLRQQKGNPPASLEKMSLRDILQAGRAILRTAVPDDSWLAKWNDKDFEEIGEVRNTVVHDKPFIPRKEWKTFAERVLRLFEIRDGFELRYQQLNAKANE